ncbi:hypothetical protein [Actinoallomurus oryzae]|jgi:hypothetical protein|uniref:hypothetical protein n=1 Tax=Actinoallomurus oryzae TaxID=502180 RepID=UPI0031EC7791
MRDADADECHRVHMVAGSSATSSDEGPVIVHGCVACGFTDPTESPTTLGWETTSAR